MIACVWWRRDRADVTLVVVLCVCDVQETISSFSGG